MTYIMAVIAWKLLLKEQLLLAIEPLIWVLEERKKKKLLERFIIHWYNKQMKRR